MSALLCVSGDRIREARDAIGVTQRDVASRLSDLTGESVWPQDISRYEREYNCPSSNRFFALAYVLECDFTDLCDEMEVAKA